MSIFAVYDMQTLIKKKANVKEKKVQKSCEKFNLMELEQNVIHKEIEMLENRVHALWHKRWCFCVIDFFSAVESKK